MQQFGLYIHRYTEAIMKSLVEGEIDIEAVYMTKKIGDDLGPDHPLRREEQDEVHQSLGEVLAIAYRENLKSVIKQAGAPIVS